MEKVFKTVFDVDQFYKEITDYITHAKDAMLPSQFAHACKRCNAWVR